MAIAAPIIAALIPYAISAIGSMFEKKDKLGGYQKLPTMTGDQTSFLQQMLGQALPSMQGAMQGFQQFLPGGGGGQAMANAAQQRFQQETIPSIMNAFGSGAKSSSALNQALAAGASNLNTDLASQLAQMQMQASQGMGALGMNMANLGMQPQFAYQQKQMPFWKSAMIGTSSGMGQGMGQFAGMALGDYFKDKMGTPMPNPNPNPNANPAAASTTPVA